MKFLLALLVVLVCLAGIHANPHKVDKVRMAKALQRAAHARQAIAQHVGHNAHGAQAIHTAQHAPAAPLAHTATHVAASANKLASHVVAHKPVAQKPANNKPVNMAHETHAKAPAINVKAPVHHGRH
eukprot:GILK01002231.1.p1 GENE.GILK01002231.1~~GILK01002231.1.p1  ORF type:complete len:138 (-),score=17.73 GILK01002231.1:159-539(-)